MSNNGLQTAEDLEKEHAALTQQPEEADATKAAGPQPPKKKKKNLIDIGALRAEQEAMDEVGSTNWTGKLTEYRAAHPVAAEGLKYLDQSVGDPTAPRFSCVVVIAESATQFGAGVSFSNKKAARQYASKKAVDWLASKQLIPADGSVRFPKVVHQPPASPAATSFAGQVPELCYKLGFNTPSYKIVEVVPGTPYYDAWADFGLDPRIEGKVGLVKGVYGKKNAKEQVAQIVLSFLGDIERQRTAAMENDGDDEQK